MTIKLIPHKPDYIIGLNIDGKIEAADLDLVVGMIEKKLSTEPKLRIYVEVNNWSGMSLGAFIKDFKFALQHFQDFEKEAIVSDRKWLESLATVGNKIFPSLEVKHFTFEERDRAWEWIDI